MSQEYKSFDNMFTIEIDLEEPFFHKLCAHDKAFNFKLPDITETEIQTGKCDRIQTIKELESFIREVKTVDEQEALFYELLKRIKGLSDLSELRSMVISIQNKKKDGSFSHQTLNYNFMTHELAIYS